MTSEKTKEDISPREDHVGEWSLAGQVMWVKIDPRLFIAPAIHNIVQIIGWNYLTNDHS